MKGRSRIISTIAIFALLVGLFFSVSVFANGTITVSGSNGEYVRSFGLPTGYEPMNADIYSSSRVMPPYDACEGYRHVSMTYGAIRRHAYVTCYDIPEPPY